LYPDAVTFNGSAASASNAQASGALQAWFRQVVEKETSVARPGRYLNIGSDSGFREPLQQRFADLTFRYAETQFPHVNPERPYHHFGDTLFTILPDARQDVGSTAEGEMGGRLPRARL
jgi:hypothetical protein